MFNIAENEKNVLDFWKRQNIFKKSIKKDAPKGDYSFYDGPPFATGLPHYGHIVASAIKDMIPRYMTMKGYSVERRWGWDCHGLPVENLIEKELGFKSKKDIEDFGVDKFNEACRASVLRYANDWKEFIPKVGRWVDMDNDYRTMNPEFMQSTWWVFKSLWDKGFIYEGHKAMHICPRCETTLANFEVTQGYKDITDLTATVKFELVDEPNTFILAWTTTPWTLPGNVALAVGENIKYEKLKTKNQKEEIEFVILAKDRIETVMKDKEFEIVSEFIGEELVGKSYKPVFDYFVNDEKIKNKENGWKIYAGDFVTTEEGTGIVHIAPAFGEDDMRLGKEYNLPFVQHVKMSGVFIDVVAKDFGNGQVKPKEDSSLMDLEIVKWLITNNKLFSKEKHKHSYPHCWRCDTPLLNYATSSWFVDINQFSSKLINNNQKVHWVPDHIKDGRFGKWIANSVDWAISRSRFWGSPLPVWRCTNDDCKHVEVIGGVEDLQNKLNNDGNDRITKIVVSRHGQSEKNIKGIEWSKNDGYPLTEKGINDIEKFSEEVNGDFDVVLCSPVLRTRQTAEIFNKKANKEIIVVEELREMNKGDWEGENVSDDIKKEIENYRKLSSEERYNYKKGNSGESFADLEIRVRKFINSLEQYKGKKILIVTHDGLKNMIEGILRGWNTEKFIYMVDRDYFGYSTIFIDNITSKEFDLHKHIVDEITFTCPKCGKQTKRISEVFDCWFESGSMPYAQLGYPFSNKTKFENMFPAEFIAEGQDQTRGWFYTLMVLGTALFDKPAFQNVVVNGIVLAEDGQKMSKKLKNYPDPNIVLNKYGADALRYYLLSSPVVSCQDLNFSEKGVEDVVKKVILKITNVLDFYKMTDPAFAKASAGESLVFENMENNSDKWIIARLNELIKGTSLNWNEYYLAEGTRLIEDFIDDLSNWYVRINRSRFKTGDDREIALSVLRYVLSCLSKVMAPVMPFISEYLYKEIDGNLESVHLESFPEYNEILIDKKFLSEISFVRNVVSLGLSIRKQKNIAARQPLNNITVVANDIQKNIILENKDVILSELNIREIEFVTKTEDIAQMQLKPNARVLGPKFGKEVQDVINKAKAGIFEVKDEKVLVDSKWEIDLADCEVVFIGKEGIDVASDHGVVVALNTEITESLKLEGIAREIISAINDLRADRNLTLSDKVNIEYYSEVEDIKKAVNDNEKLILNNVAADSIVLVSNDGKEFDINESKVSIKIK